MTNHGTKLANNARRSYRRAKPQHYCFNGFDIEIRPESPSNQKWQALRRGAGDALNLGYHATVGSAVRAIRAYRNKPAA